MKKTIQVKDHYGNPCTIFTDKITHIISKSTGNTYVRFGQEEVIVSMNYEEFIRLLNPPQ